MTTGKSYGLLRPIRAWYWHRAKRPLNFPTRANLPYWADAASNLSLPCVKGGGTACRGGGIVKRKILP